MAIYMRNKEKSAAYGDHDLTQTDVITTGSFHCIYLGNLIIDVIPLIHKINLVWNSATC